MIQKPGKPAGLAESYWPISLLSVKIIRKTSIAKVLCNNGKAKNNPHQFDFRHKHPTIEQIHRIIKSINIDMNISKYYTAAFLDIS